MARERIVSGAPVTPDEDILQFTLRPKTLNEYVGQRELKEKLQVLLHAAKMRQA